MAITAGNYGAAQTAANTNETDLFNKDSGHNNRHSQWKVALSGDAGTVKVYQGSTQVSEFVLAAGESEEVGCREGQITRITLTADSTSTVVSWFPKILGVKG